MHGAVGLHKLFLRYIGDEYSVVEVWIRGLRIDKVREGEGETAEYTLAHCCG